MNFLSNRKSTAGCYWWSSTSWHFRRRSFFGFSLAAVSASAFAEPARKAERNGAKISPRVLRRAFGALERHRAEVPFHDSFGVADFSLPSHEPRFYVVTLGDGTTRSHLVAHGKGSDPSHTGWLQGFSNESHSNATSAGAYLTSSFYEGAHGISIRLQGLDPTNSNALSRGIVVHGASYVSERVIESYGKLGRSQGCFAVAEGSLSEIMTRLAPGRLIYAARDEDPPNQRVF